MINNFNISILLNPQLSHDNVMNTAGRVGPGVGFIVTVEQQINNNYVSDLAVY